MSIYAHIERHVDIDEMVATHKRSQASGELTFPVRLLGFRGCGRGRGERQRHGDPLSGLGLSAGPSTAGITEGGRVMFYGLLGIGGLVLVVGGLLLTTFRDSSLLHLSGMVVRTYALVALGGFLGLLLDYRDGPVSTVQLIAYIFLFLGALRLVRISIVVSALGEGAANRVDKESEVNQRAS